MELAKTRIEIGLERPFRALHLTDSHIALADERDDARKRELARARTAGFEEAPGSVLRYLDGQLRYAREQGLPVLYTGDMIDFVSWKNLEYARGALEGIDYFMAVGNHEFSLYVGEEFEDGPYRARSYERVQAYFRNDLTFASRVMGGVNFVAVDDGYYHFDADQLRRLRAEAARGLPIVLMLHTPLHTDDLYCFVRGELGHPCGYLVGTPEPLLADYDDYRYRQQKPDADTLAFIDYVYGQPLIHAVLAGHLHYGFETCLPGGIAQYVTGAGYRDRAREIEFC